MELSCFCCEKIFSTSAQVTAHVEEEHTFECYQCGKIMESKSASEMHMKEHSDGVKTTENAQYFDELFQMCNKLENALGNNNDKDKTLENMLGDESFDIMQDDFNDEVVTSESDFNFNTSIRIKEESANSDPEISYIKEDSFNEINVVDFNMDPETENLIKQYDWSHRDTTVPLGWMTSWDKIIQSKRFLSPTGKFFASRVHAIFYMSQQGTEKAQVTEMKEGLLDDGWNTDENLPEGWFVRKVNDGETLIYFTDDNFLLESFQSALDFMENSDKYGRVEIENLWNLYSVEQMVPNGWSRNVKVIDKNRRMVSFTTPNGTTLVGIINALNYMRENNFSEEDIIIVKENLLEDGWTKEEFLPEGWYIKPIVKRYTDNKSTECVYYFLTNEFKKFKSFKKVGEFLKNFGESGLETHHKMFAGLEELRKSFRKKHTILNDQGHKLPVDWQLKIAKRADTSHVYYFITSNGTKITGLIRTLQYMIDENYSTGDIEPVVNFLKDEGWTKDKLLPNGWHMMKRRKNRYSHSFLTESFQIMQSSTQTFDHFKNNDKYSQVDISNFTTLLARLSGKINENRWTWSTDNEAIQNGWKIRPHPNPNQHFILSPNGTQFVTVRQALRYMFENDLSIDDIDAMVQYLPKEGWQTDSLLPNGWHMRPERNEHKGRFKYLTDDFRYIESNTSAMDFLKSCGKANEEDINKFECFLQQHASKGLMERWNWSGNNEMVPDGWKVLACPTNDKKYLVISPDGAKFDAIRVALKYMVENNFNEKDIEVMAKHLIKERWKSDEKLPAGWYYRRSDSDQSKVSFDFLTIDFKVISSIKNVVEYLKKSSFYDQETIDKFLEKLDEERICARQNLYESKGTAESLPHGWKMRNIQKKDGRTTTFFLSPEGVNFTGIRQLLQYMVEHKYDKQDINIMSKHLIKEGWKTDELLPKGWYMKPERTKSKKINFLTDNFQFIRTNTMALDVLKNDGRFTKEEVQRFITLVNKDSVKGDGDNWNLNEENSKVPDGWKIQTCPTNNRRNYVLSPSGLKFETIRQSLEYMAENNYKKEDINIMAKHLIKEGWETHELLPKGWYMKPERTKSRKFNFLSDNFQFIRTNTLALDVLKNNGKFTKDEVQRFIRLVNKDSMKGDEDNFNLTEEKYKVPDGWKIQTCPTNNRRNYVLSPSGLKFETIRQSLEYMAKNNYKKQDIDIMAKHLIKEGWEMHELLPKGWYMKTLKHRKSSRMDYLTDVFKHIQSNTIALDDLKNNGRATDDDIQNFLTLVKKNSVKGIKENWNEESDQVPDGWKILMCPTNNKRNSVISPSGLKFDTIRQSLQYKVENNYKKQDIDIMAKHLVKEGWETHELLPKGWRMKSVKHRKSNRLDYLSDVFKYIQSNTAALDDLKTIGRATEDDIQKFMTLVKKNSVKGIEENWNKESNQVPDGWKILMCPTNNKRNYVISPSGLKFDTIRQSLQYMVKNEYNNEHVNIMENHLIKEGWETDKSLPKGWYMKLLKRRKSHRMEYLSDSFQLIQSNRAAFDVLRNNKKATKEDIENFKTFINKNSSKGIEEGWTWNEDNYKVPDGWRIRTCPTNNRRNCVISPSGLKFGSIRQSLEYMVTNKYNNQDVDLMAKHLIKEGWETHESLPQGWYMKLKKSPIIYFLSDVFQLLRSNTAALEVLKNNGRATREDIQKFTALVNKNSTKGMEESCTWDKENEKVPVGWKIRTCPTNSKKSYVIAPSGLKFVTIRQSLQYMIKNSCKPKDIETLAKHLIREGWETNDCLPKGWYMKSRNDKKTRINTYLNDIFQKFQTNKLALNDLKNNRRATKEDIKKFMRLVEKNSVKGIEENWNNESDQVPDGWKIRTCPTNDRKNFVISPSGLKFETIRQSLQYMVKNRYDNKDIDIMAKNLIKEGWETNASLPKGWYLKPEQYKNKKSCAVDYLSDVFQRIQSNTKALEYLKNNGRASEEDILNFMIFVDQSFKKGSEERYSWMDSDGTCPVTWKMRPIVKKDGKKQCFFLPPDSTILKGRIEALQYIAENGYPQHDLDNMREGLNQEGWIQHKNLPKNWLFNQHYLGHELKVISPFGKKISSMKAVQEYINKTSKAFDMESAKRKSTDDIDLEKGKNKKIKRDFI